MPKECVLGPLGLDLRAGVSSCSARTDVFLTFSHFLGGCYEGKLSFLRSHFYFFFMVMQLFS